MSRLRQGNLEILEKKILKYLLLQWYTLYFIEILVKIVLFNISKPRFVYFFHVYSRVPNNRAVGNFSKK